MTSADLEKHFSLNQWERFVAEVTRALTPVERQLASQLQQRGFPEDIATALAAVFENEAVLGWVEEAIPALSGGRPIDLIKDEEGLKRLKVCITRLPV